MIGCPVNPSVERSAACISDLGRRRRHNEDNFGENPKLGLWIVADGVGGHAAGDVASDLAVSHILRLAGDGMPVAEAVSATHEIIRRAPLQGIGKPGMATTVVVAHLKGRNYRVFWVGDSRAYVHGSEGLKRLTVDHSYVQQLLDSGAITDEEAAVHPQRSVITQCLGWDGHSTVQVGEVAGELYRGEVLLLCTDGLTGEVDDADIAAVLRKEAPLPERAQRLVDKANANGGSDNITAALIPAPADAPPRSGMARGRPTSSRATMKKGTVRRRRRSHWRERVVELAPALRSYLREAFSAIGARSAPPPLSSLDVSHPDRNSSETNGPQEEDSAEDVDLLGDERESNPLHSDRGADA